MNLYVCDIGDNGETIFNEGQGLYFRSYCSSLKRRFPESKFEVSVRPLKKKRTLPQNSYYWAIQGHLANAYGYSSEEMHELIMEACNLGEYVKHPFLRGAEFFFRRWSSTKLGTKEFGTMIDFVLHEINEYNSIREESEWIKIPAQ